MKRAKNWVPEEVIVHILSYLPVRCLSKFRVVCKRWNTLFLHPHLGYLHNIHYLLSASEDLGHIGIFSTTIGLGGHEPRAVYTQISQSNQGLLLERTVTPPLRHRIFSLSLCQGLDIPNPQYPSLCIALDFVPSNQSVKLVSVDEQNHSFAYQVLALGVGSDPATYCWRPIIINLQQQQQQQQQKRTGVQFFFRMGVAHCIWHVESPGGGDVGVEVDILDMVNETYIGHTRVCGGLFSKLSRTNILDWNGRLSLAELVKDELHVLVLEDHTRLKWAEQLRIIKLGFLKPDHEEKLRFSICADKSKLFFLREEKHAECAYDINTGELFTLVMPAITPLPSAEPFAAWITESMFFKDTLGIKLRGWGL